MVEGHMATKCLARCEFRTTNGAPINLGFFVIVVGGVAAASIYISHTIDTIQSKGY